MTPPRRAKANSRNRQQIAKALRDAAGCTYQQALQRVEDAADRGLLPAVLDKAGRQEAVRLLSAPLGSSGPASAPTRDERASLRTSPVPGAPGGADKTTVRTEPDHAWWRPDVSDLAISEFLTSAHRKMTGLRAAADRDPYTPTERSRVWIMDLDPQPSLTGPWRDGSGYEPVILDVPPPGMYDPSLGLSPAQRDEVLRQLRPET
ncbi:hypothetical protein [Streptomyces sp. NPDC046985]|uniref:hypothetical protein n=1 Tax=Streptomyces sp. NPDC046985 TaxID=3155377 RepID=UPI0033EE9969